MQSGKPMQEAQEDHIAKNPHPMLPVFCQVNMTKKVTQEMFMYQNDIGTLLKKINTNFMFIAGYLA